MTAPTSNPLKTGYSALVIANKFLDLARAQGKELTQMQVHKLVYIAHGFTMALLGRPLIYNTVHAWEKGPVITDIRKVWGRGANLPTSSLEINAHEPELTQEDSQALTVLQSVWDSYGSLPGEELSRLTHQPGSPWEQIYGQPSDLIPNEITRAYYIALTRK